MIKIFWTACKRLLRIVWKCFKWLFLFTLPLTIITIITGVSNGFYFAFWIDDRVEMITDTLIQDVKDLANDWGLPEMTFRDFQDKNNYFHVLRLNSNDWASKLGFIQPLEYGQDVKTGINELAGLDRLMLDISPRCQTPPPKEQWVYISEWAWPEISEWDSAFEAAIQAGYVPSALNESRLFYAHCSGTASFLCGVWGVKGPALLHFSTEDSAPGPEDIAPGLTYSASLADLRAVTVRVIEFPLSDAYTALPSSVFPGPREQILAMMRGHKLYEQFEPWHEFDQTILRFYEYLDDNFYDRKGTFWYYLAKASLWTADYLHKPLGLEEADSMVYTISFVTTLSVVKIFILLPWHWVRQSFLDLLGYPKRGYELAGDGFQKKWNPWDEFMGLASAFTEGLDEIIATAQFERGYSDGKITTSSWSWTAPSAAESSSVTA